MQYRREIDGLRAVAVVPVILFHAGYAAVSGGFVGVDVFFVISGYLITSIITGQKQAGTFTFAGFYERRVRRILPALFLVVAASLPFAWFWFPPEQMARFAESVAAISVFASNILFWQQSSYFDVDALLRPLLHTWTLAVEEQFYVLFPLFIVVLWPLGKRRIAAITALCALASLALAEWAAYYQPDAGFFLLPTRGWELGIGALAAFYLGERPVAEIGRRPREALSALGLAAIVYAVFAFTEDTPYPSVWTLAPTLGTALIILYAAPDTLTGRLLGSAPLVGIGLISYSAYLWHQPIFAFIRGRTLLEPGATAFALGTLAAFILAFLSWKFVERPFRDRRRFTRRRIFAMALAGSATLFAFGAVGYLTDGAFGRYAPGDPMLTLEQSLEPNYGLAEECDHSFTLSPKCRTSDQPEIMVWGDSFAMHLVRGVLASNPRARVIQSTVVVCGPVLDMAPLANSDLVNWAKDCIHTNDQVFAYLQRSKTIKYVVLGSLFEPYLGKGQKVMLRDGTVTDDDAVTLRYFERTLARLQALGIKPVVFGPTPRPGHDVGRCLTRATFFGIPRAKCDFPFAETARLQGPTFALLHKLARDSQVIWLDAQMCQGETCRAEMDGVFLYRDDGHLSRKGSDYLGKTMDWYGLITQGRPRPRSGGLPQP